MSPTDLARGDAISLRQAIGMQTPKAIELWMNVVDDPTEQFRCDFEVQHVAEALPVG